MLEVEGWTTAEKHFREKLPQKHFHAAYRGWQEEPHLVCVTLWEKTQHLLQHLPSPSPPSAPWAKQPDLQLGEKGNAKKPSGRREWS